MRFLGCRGWNETVGARNGYSMIRLRGCGDGSNTFASRMQKQGINKYVVVEGVGGDERKCKG